MCFEAGDSPMVDPPPAEIQPARRKDPGKELPLGHSQSIFCVLGLLGRQAPEVLGPPCLVGSFFFPAETICSAVQSRNILFGKLMLHPAFTRRVS